MAPPVGVGIVLLLLHLPVGGLVLILLGLGLAAFYRDPDRTIPSDPRAVVAAADGRVVEVVDLPEDRFLKGPARKVGIFLSLQDVHVNRAPVAGTVRLVAHQPGSYLPAYAPAAARENAQTAVVLDADDGPPILVVQVAGILVRRIVTRLVEGQHLRRGERFGLICFGSRLDIYLPPTARVAVRPGDRVRAGASLIGYLP